MKNFITTLFALFFTVTIWAQGTLTGTVMDSDQEDALIGATVYLKGTNYGTATDYNGAFEMTGVDAGDYTMVISYTGYAEMTKDITVTDGANDLGKFMLTGNSIGIEEVNVIASIAVDRRTPVAVSNISAETIEAKLGNQEFPEILKSTPSIYATKTGGGFGDARINVRGFSQENVALLINGIPVNGMEDNKVYWSNWAGLGDVTRNIQIQRGLGASRLAVTSVGGTINILTKTTDQKQGGAVSQSFGNDGFSKTGITLSTGRTDNGWAVTFAGSRTTGDGYVEGTYIDAWSYFGSIAKEIGDNQQLLFTIFGAPQRHGQRSFWHPIDDQSLKYGTKWNDDFGYYKGQEFSIRDNFYHKPQASLTHIWDVNEKTSLITAVYGSTGRGGGTGDIGGTREFLLEHDKNGNQQFDEIAKWNQGLDNNLNFVWGQPVGTFDDYNYIPAGTTDTLSGRIISKNNGMIKRASMNEHQWYGLLSTLNTKISDNLTFNGGIDLRWYTGSHYRKTIDLLGGDYWFDRDDSNNRNDWVDFDRDGQVGSGEMGNLVRPKNDASRLFGSVDTDERIDYYNDENINWYGLFGQIEYTQDALTAFVSGAYNYTQMRRIDFFNKPEGSNTTDWLSFSGGNIKTGANYNITENHNVFANVGYIIRAPYFDALFPTFNNDAPNENPETEKVTAFELGYGYRGSSLRFNFNGYYTNWQDKTEVIDFADTLNNQFFLNLLGVAAVHKGLEMDLQWLASPKFTVSAFASLNDWQWEGSPTGTVSDENQTVIGEATYYIDGLKVGDAAQTTFGLGLNYDFGYGVAMDLQYNFYKRLYASYAPNDRDDEANADLQPLKLDDYALMDLGLTWKFDLGGLDARARVNVNNLFDTEYIAEAADRVGTDTREQRILDTRGWYGFGRTWNAGLKINF